MDVSVRTHECHREPRAGVGAQRWYREIPAQEELTTSGGRPETDTAQNQGQVPPEHSRKQAQPGSGKLLEGVRIWPEGRVGAEPVSGKALQAVCA